MKTQGILVSPTGHRILGKKGVLLVVLYAAILSGITSPIIYAQEYYPFLQVDVGANNDPAQTQEGFVSFTMLDSGAVFNGITVELESNAADGKLDSRRRTAPTGIPLEQIFRDFVFARPGGFRLTLSGLEPSKTYQITIFAYDTMSGGQRICDWVNVATNEVVLTTSFSSGDAPSEASHGFKGITQTDENGTLVLEAVANPGHPGDIFAFINGLVISTDKPITKSWLPVPEDGALISTTEVGLGWNYGQTSVSSNLFLGESYDVVLNATTSDKDIFIGNIIEIPVLIGSPGNPYPNGLTPGKTYYWRTDELEEDGTAHKGDVWSFTVASEKAVILYPYNGGLYIDPNVLLTWTPGPGSVEHRVFFGESLQDVQSGTGGTDKGSVTEPNYAPGLLDRNTTYYWRIDEYDGTDTHTGDVWSFTTNLAHMGTVTMDIWENVAGEHELANLLDDPRYPGSPTRTEILTEFGTVDGVGDGYGGQITGWLYCPAGGEYNFFFTCAGAGELWLSTDDDPTNAVLLGTETTWGSYNVFTIKSAAISLVAGERYYLMARWKDFSDWDHCQVAWQGAGIPNQEIIRGSYLTPFDPVVAYGPNPALGRVDTEANPKFSWRSGKYAASHIIHLGTDPNVLDQVGTSLRGDESYIYHSLLLFNQVYYWRIDEVNDLDPNSPWIGKTWSFTTGNHVVVDDFEVYNNLSPNLPFQTWLDGYGYEADDYFPEVYPGNGTGSAVGHDIWSPGSPFYQGDTMETGIALPGSSQSMPVYYDNSEGVSEVERSFPIAQDWTVQGLSTLILNVQGDSNNSAEALSVSLVDQSGSKATVTFSNTSLMQSSAWQKWEILTSDFAGVDLSKVQKIIVGVANQAGGFGIFYLDDILLTSEKPATDPKIVYVDATEGETGNTTLATGEVFTSVPDASGTNNLWRNRVFGNNGTIFESGGDTGGDNTEDCPRLMTVINVPEGTYEVYAYFWSDGSGWRLAASLTEESDMPLFVAGNADSPAIEADTDAFEFPVPLVTEGNRTLWQVLLGTTEMSSAITVYIDDEPSHETVNSRTWYDGIGYKVK